MRPVRDAPCLAAVAEHVAQMASRLRVDDTRARHLNERTADDHIPTDALRQALAGR